MEVIMDKEFIEDIGKIESDGSLPFSLGTRLGNLVFLSGMVSKDIKTGEPEYGSITDETRKVLSNIDSLLKAAGSSPEKILKVNVYLTDIADFQAMNAVYSAYFDEKKKLAARSTVEAKLVGKYKIEIEVIAYI